MNVPLPSQRSAQLLVSGEPLAILPVLAHAAGRGALIFVGALVAGAEFKSATRAAIGGALMIELLVIGHELNGAIE